MLPTESLEQRDPTQSRRREWTWCMVEGAVRSTCWPKGYDPELPVVQCGGAHIAVKHDAHLVEALARDGHPSGWQLLLAQAVGHKQCSGATDTRLWGTRQLPHMGRGPQCVAGLSSSACLKKAASCSQGSTSHTAPLFEHCPTTGTQINRF